MLASVPRLHDELVFPGTGGRPKSLQSAWERVRTAAKLECFRMHDLRHSFASAGAGAGQGLLLIGSLMGHRRPTTTARYAHLAEDPRCEAAEVIGARIAASLDGEPAEVVRLHG